MSDADMASQGRAKNGRSVAHCWDRLPNRISTLEGRGDIADATLMTQRRAIPPKISEVYSARVRAEHDRHESAVSQLRQDMREEIPYCYPSEES